MNKNELDVKMSVDVLKQQTVIKKELPIDEDSFDIFFDIYNSEKETYLYIKLVENSAVAPFYYNRSYRIEDLQQIHRIFKADSMKEVKNDLNELFKAKKVKLFYDKESDGIIMELEVSLFATNYKINLELYKEMIPENEKDEQLINLYNINKRKLKFAKEMFAFLNSYKGNIDKKIINEFKENFDLDDKAELNNFNIEVSDNIQNLDNKTLFNACKNKVQDEKLKKFFK